MSLTKYNNTQAMLFLDMIKLNIISIPYDNLVILTKNKSPDIEVWCDEQWPDQPVISYELNVRIVTSEPDTKYQSYAVFLFQDPIHAMLFKLVFSDIVSSLPVKYYMMTNSETVQSDIIEQLIND